MTFVQRRLEVMIELAQATGNQPNVFQPSGARSLTLNNHRASARVQNAGGVAGSKATVSVWGMSQSVMNQLSTVGVRITLKPRNTLTLSAGNVGGALTKVFVGTVMNAWADYNQAPDVPFHFDCDSVGATRAILFNPSSYTGGTDVATILKSIADKNGWGFENNGVTAQLPSPYLKGSAWQQVQKVAHDARVHAQLINNVLVILPLYGSRKGAIPLVAPPPDGEMIGYPSFTPEGIIVKTVFDPRIVMHGQIKVESSIFTTLSLEKRANPSSTWTVQKLDLALDDQVPKGKWESIAYAYTSNPNFAPVIPPKS